MSVICTKRFYCSSDLYSKSSHITAASQLSQPPRGLPTAQTHLPTRPGARRAPAFALTAFAAAGLALAWLVTLTLTLTLTLPLTLTRWRRQPALHHLEL